MGTRISRSRAKPHMKVLHMITLQGLNSRFKIGTRIRFGFMTVLALILLISTVGYFNLRRADDAMDQYADTSRTSVKVTETDRDLANMRRDALVYVQTG